MRNPVVASVCGVVWGVLLGVHGGAAAEAPVASGPGVGLPAVLFEAPDPPGFWAMGSVWFGTPGYIDLSFEVPAGAAGGTYTVILTVTNDTGQDLGAGLDLWLTGPAAFSASPFPVSLAPLGDLPTVFEDDHLRFEGITWADGDSNILNTNLTVSGAGPVQVRLAPIPEPGTLGGVLLGGMVLLRRGRR